MTWVRRPKPGIDRRLVLTAIGSGLLSVGLPNIARAQKKSGKRSMIPNKGQRLEPLFLSEADAREIIDTYCVKFADEPLQPTQVELLISRLKRQLWLSPQPGDGPIGATRFGGAPDLSRETAWPLRAALPERSKAAAAEKWSNPWVVRQLAETVPFEFIAQINLAEAGRFAAHAEGLPPSGRLLFFLDDAVLMSQPAAPADACRVIFDQTPVDQLDRLVVPNMFEAMETWWRTPDPKQIEHFNAMVRQLESDGQKDAAKAVQKAARHSEKPDPSIKKPFVYPSRAKMLVPLWVLPNYHAIESTLDADLTLLADGGDPGSPYAPLTTNDTGPFSSDPNDMRVTQSWLTMEARRNRCLGPAIPEQDDPRFDAIAASERPPYPWDATQIEAMSRKASDWVLLLQVSMADLSQTQREGTIYFMIHKDDLAKRDFSRAVVSYQQT